MAKLLEIISDMNDLVLQGKALEAFEKYYHEDVIIQENSNTPTKGKKENRQLINSFLSSVIDFRSAKPLKVALGQNVSMVEWYYSYSHRIYGEVTYQQVSVQEWREGLIIKEKHYYHDTYSQSINQATGDTLIVLFNLKQNVNPDAYEAFAREVDSPTIKRLSSTLEFKILKGLNLFGSSTPSPYEYIEILQVSGFEELAVDIQNEEVQHMLRQFTAFAEDPKLIITKQLN